MADMERMQADVNQLEGKRLAGYFVDAVNNAGMGGAPVELSSLLNATVTDARDRLAAWTYQHARRVRHARRPRRADAAATDR